MNAPLNLHDALMWSQRLHEALGLFRGEPLDPAHNTHDHLRGLGFLTAWCAQPEHAKALQDALQSPEKDRSGRVRSLFRRWERGEHGRGLVRVFGVLLRAWAWDAEERGHWAQAQQWFEESFQRMEYIFQDTEAFAVPHHVVWSALLEEHARVAMEHVDHARWSQARLHWGLCVAWNTCVDDALFAQWSAALEERCVIRSESYAQESAGRGVLLADGRALEATHQGLLVLPNSGPLHVRNVVLCVQEGLFAWSRMELEAIRAHTDSLRASLEWLDDHPEETPESLASTRAHGWTLVCVDEPHPRRAVDALRKARQIHPAHPTAHELLGHALAAWSAYALGAGDPRTAREAYTEARGILGDLPKLALLQRALQAA